MALALNRRTTVLLTGVAAVTGGISAVADTTQIADFFGKFENGGFLTATKAMLLGSTVPSASVITAGIGAGLIGYFIARKSARGREARLETKAHRSEHFLRTDLAHTAHRLEHYSMSPNSLCRNMAHLLRGVCTDAEQYFTEKEGRTCTCTVHLLCEDGTLHAVEYRSRDGMERRKNLSRSDITFGTNMKRIEKLKPTDPPVARTEKISAREPDWRDPCTDDHEGLYDASLTVGIQCRPDDAFDYGHFTPDLSSRRVLAGFLTIDTEASKFRSPAVEETAFRFADRLFSVVREYSKAHFELTGEGGSPISWVYRDIAGVRYPKNDD